MPGRRTASNSLRSPRQTTLLSRPSPPSRAGLAGLQSRRLAAVRGKPELDLSVDPAPDLVIEIDGSRSSLKKLLVFAAVGVAEVWRYDGERVRIYGLRGDRYTELLASEVLPPLTAAQLSTFLEQTAGENRSQWMRKIRRWVQIE